MGNHSAEQKKKRKGKSDERWRIEKRIEMGRRERKEREGWKEERRLQVNESRAFEV